MRPKIISIVGPTASGKTRLGFALARRFNGEIICVDSRQVYRGMDIGTAKSGEPQWGIDLVNPNEPYSAADFKVYAMGKIKEIIGRSRIPILVGGTGFWLKVVIDNLDLTSTSCDPALRAQLEARTLRDLFCEYKQRDPEGAELIDKQNKRRVVRALEVTKLTGKPWSQQQTAGESLYDVLQIGLSVPREELVERMNARVDEMVAHGLVLEVRRLRDRYGCEIESMTGIGYRQICKFLSGKQSLPDAIAEVKRDTRWYAKRQMTWFKRDKRIKWVKPGESVNVIVADFLKRF